MLVQKHALREQAWQLGAGSAMEQKLLQSGRIVLRADGRYELFSQEISGGQGEIARAGDYFKVAADGSPYPNERAHFEKTHQPLGADWYLQTAEPRQAWRADEPIGEAVRFLLDSGRLELHPEDPERFFSARLWGTRETAARDATLVFYRIDRDPQGRIAQTDFNFVSKAAFDETYEVLEQPLKEES